ncbi:hypothetical protein KKF05_05420 [Patescibacteria group bacterium]|nr:hypothetical protein [Patescibacteria group bacterium]MBU1028761.1 hypothetical protein [Patescibacteria group bacterium]MBU1916083.1 hypothetical protein [Patescibacteria group bacterium]
MLKENAKQLADNKQATTTGSLDLVSLMSKVNKLPSVLRQYFLSNELTQARNLVYDKHGLSNEDESVVFITELQVFLKEIDIRLFPDVLWNRLDWDESRGEDAIGLVADILGFLLMPASAFIGDVVGVLNEFGIDTKKYPLREIKARVISYAEATDDVLKSVDLEKLSINDEKRLRFIIESRLRDVRDDTETLAMLIKSKKVGGLELSETSANKIIKVLNDERALTRYVEQTEKEETGEASVENSKFTPEQIKQRLVGSVEEQQELAKRIENLNLSSEGSVDALKERLYQLVFEPVGVSIDDWDIVAALFVLTKQGGLLEALSKDVRYREGLKTFAEGRDASQLKEIKNSPAGRVAINMFLQVTLRGMAGLSDEDAARYGLRIINLLKKAGQAQYSDLVAFDLDDGKFVWTEPIEM